jgi:hypothetical protein
MTDAPERILAWVDQGPEAEQRGVLEGEWVAAGSPRLDLVQSFTRDDIADARVAAERERCANIAHGFGRDGHLKSKFTKKDGSPVLRMSAHDAARHGQWIAECIEVAIREQET